MFTAFHTASIYSTPFGNVPFTAAAVAEIATAAPHVRRSGLRRPLRQPQNDSPPNDASRPAGRGVNFAPRWARASVRPRLERQSTPRSESSISNEQRAVGPASAAQECAGRTPSTDVPTRANNSVSANNVEATSPSTPAARGRDVRGSGNGMLHANKVVNRWGVAWRHIIMRLIGKLPGTRFKSRLISRLLGVRMGRDVGLAYDTFIDPYDPTMVSFGDNVIVGYGTKIFVHAFTLNRQRVRPVTIGSNVMIGGFCVIAPGVSIGDGASVAPGTIVSRDVPPGGLAMGNTMRIRKRGGTTSPVD